MKRTTCPEKVFQPQLLAMTPERFVKSFLAERRSLCYDLSWQHAFESDVPLRKEKNPVRASEKKGGKLK
ncbi:hypothetical protein SAMN04488123_104197 [Natribacillus halophilus]|uniref:Uncharacterized protein n=1 Tax=Natribacillus halophilus TaxID=549003 RepID=A0A1G8MJ61_9BACI|nr:hypothetical protein SAMN04488123_104197 [Natribacillus halophilus]